MEKSIENGGGKDRKGIRLKVCPKKCYASGVIMISNEQTNIVTGE